MPSAAKDRPNVVLILTDEQHIESLGHAGALPVRTPHIDRLADEGTRFTSAFCCSSLCSPSRAALFTGSLPHRFGTVDNGLTLPPGTTNLGQLLYEAGYRLGYIGKWHIDDASMPRDHHFEGHNFPGYGSPGALFRSTASPQGQAMRQLNDYYEYLAGEGYDLPQPIKPIFSHQPHPQRLLSGQHSGPVEASIPHFLGTSTVDLIHSFARRKQNEGAPFFLWTNFWGPHNPHVLPSPYDTLYDPADIPEPPSASDPLTDKPYVQTRFSQYWGMHNTPWAEWQRHIAHYLGYCTLIDEQVGRIRQALEETGELDNTIFVYASDHGDMLGRHQQMDKGPFAYDDTYRVPLIVRGPGITAGTCDEFVYLHDLFTTCLDFAHATIPQSTDLAQSLRPLLHDKSGGTSVHDWSQRDAVFGEFDSLVGLGFSLRMIRTRSHKFIYNCTDRCELYDLEGDPHELRNRTDDSGLANIKHDLKSRLLAHLESTHDKQAARVKAIFDYL